jgi:D-serine deaminase-like pyridoxal phosphate-dependent protein
MAPCLITQGALEATARAEKLRQVSQSKGLRLLCSRIAFKFTGDYSSQKGSPEIMKTAFAPSPLLKELTIDAYRVKNIETVLTPALAIYPEIVDANIATTVRLLGGNENRWRPHVKTAKLRYVMQRYVAQGIQNFKCSTSLELQTVCEAGAGDVLLAYPVVGANARRVRQLSEQFSKTRVSALVENVEQIDAWRGSTIGLFIDVNPGMNRTGVEQDHIDEIAGLAKAIETAGLEFRGLHYYDGHMGGIADFQERQTTAHQGYDRLMKLVSAFEQANIKIAEVITAGTPAFPCSLSYRPFAEASFIHRISPGTVVYGDCTSLAQLPAEYGYQVAAVVISTVVSQPTANHLTCDAGHKTVSADAGVPNCFVLGHADLTPQHPSEEHLPIEIAANAHADAAKPGIGDTLYLVPKHVCPTVNNFDHAIIVEGGRIVGVERVTARGREVPIRSVP